MRKYLYRGVVVLIAVATYLNIGYVYASLGEKVAVRGNGPQTFIERVVTMDGSGRFGAGATGELTNNAKFIGMQITWLLFVAISLIYMGISTALYYVVAGGIVKLLGLV